MPLMYCDEYHCTACGHIPDFERGEWACECVAVNDYVLANGAAEHPPCWEPLPEPQDVPEIILLPRGA
jgi:hypothetical protein